MDDNDNPDSTVLSERSQFNCDDCQKVFTHRSSFYKHRRDKHNYETTGNFTCKEAGCTFSSRNMKQLQDHLFAAHAIQISQQQLQFSSNAEFLQWKVAYEKLNDCWFISRRGIPEASCNNVVTQRFYCNRSGFHNSTSSGKRSLKSQGTSKLDSFCTAGITVRVQEDTGIVNAVLTDTHYGHDLQLAHLRLTRAEKLDIGHRLSQGVKMDRILDDIRCSLNKDLERVHLITRQDIRNIEYSMGLKGISKHADDATSVDMWVKEMSQKPPDENPVIIYKPQGEASPEGVDVLPSDDFLLGIMTNIQKKMLKSFGNRVICMDATHGTNAYDFTLVTVLVVDEFGEGFPVAWCISNREDRTALTCFLKKVKDAVGEVDAQWLMTDDAEQYYSAWVSVFTHKPKKLLCAWHVDRAWRNALKSHISDVETQSAVYKTLRCLVEETSTEKFEQLLEKVYEKLAESDSTESFGVYFKGTYGSRTSQWAACFRKGARINTNMYVEAFHHTLKYLYMKGFVNKRVDRCVDLLIQFVRDKSFDRLVKLQKGKLSRRRQDINTRHGSSLKMSIEGVTPDGPSQWKVKSSDDGQDYTVQRSDARCQLSCELSCHTCKMCIHEFNCSCVDCVVRGTLCKHTHLVARYLRTSTSSEASTATPDQPTHTEVLKETEIIENISNPANPVRGQPKTKDQLLQKLEELKLCVEECQTSQAISASSSVYMHLDAAVQLIKASQVSGHFSHSHPFKDKENSPHHLPIPVTQQRRPKFKSTKQKRKPASVRLAKPSKEEKNNIVSDLYEDITSPGMPGGDHDYCSQSVQPENPTKPSRKQEKIIVMMTSKASLDKVKKGNVINSTEIDVEKVPDSLVDVDAQHIDEVCQFFARDAWLSMLTILHSKKQHWKCVICTHVTTKWDMVECGSCDKWYHWKCVDLSVAPPGDWFCSFCRSAMRLRVN